jgi:hypothetical protein
VPEAVVTVPAPSGVTSAPSRVIHQMPANVSAAKIPNAISNFIIMSGSPVAAGRIE